MPRANRYIVPDQIYHVTHRCHDRSFLFTFGKDRDVLLEALAPGRRWADVSRQYAETVQRALQAEPLRRAPCQRIFAYLRNLLKRMTKYPSTPSTKEARSPNTRISETSRWLAQYKGAHSDVKIGSTVDCPDR